METLDLKKLIKFNPDRISREMLDDKPEMRIALMCLEPGQKLDPHKAPLRLLMYVVEGKGTFTVGEEEMEADELRRMMKDAEADADRQGMQEGGMMEEEQEVDQFGRPIDSDIARDELKKNMMSVKPRYR